MFPSISFKDSFEITSQKYTHVLHSPTERAAKQITVWGEWRKMNQNISLYKMLVA